VSRVPETVLSSSRRVPIGSNVRHLLPLATSMVLLSVADRFGSSEPRGGNFEALYLLPSRALTG